MQKALTLVDTTVGKKAIVGVTGVILFGFVIGHLTGNLLVFLGEEALDDYGHLLHAIPELLWGVRAVLLLSLITHIVLTIDVARKARAARKVAYRKYQEAAPMSALQTLGRTTMLLTGPLLAVYIVVHLAHLTGGAPMVPGYEFQDGHPYANVVHGFRVWWITAFYMACNALLCLHLFHGGQALFQSIGFNHPKYERTIKRGAALFATFVGVGNVTIPLLVLARVVGGDVPEGANMELKSNVPTGPIEKRWSQRKFDAVFSGALSAPLAGPAEPAPAHPGSASLRSRARGPVAAVRVLVAGAGSWN